MSGAAIFALLVLVSVGGGLLLWGAVDAERNQRRVMDREEAERAARRDTGDGARRDADEE